MIHHTLDAADSIVRPGSDLLPAPMPPAARDTTLAELTAELVAAYVSYNAVPREQLPALVRSVHAALASLGTPEAAPAPAEPPKPAVPVSKSVTRDYIVSLETGERLKSLKRHIGRLGMSPGQYRAKWGLPYDYPMVAPAYSEARSALARGMGLGRKAKKEAA